MARIVSSIYTLINVLIPSFYAVWPLFIVALSMVFTLQWWLIVPHPDGLHWIIGSITVLTLGFLLTGAWLRPTLYTELMALRQTILPTLTINGVLVLCDVLTHSLIGLIVGITQSLSLPSFYWRRWWIIGSTIAYGVSGIQTVYVLSQ
ncbi:hypothetical protein [Herpetosiphon gulosus]